MSLKRSKLRYIRQTIYVLTRLFTQRLYKIISDSAGEGWAVGALLVSVTGCGIGTFAGTGGVTGYMLDND